MGDHQGRPPAPPTTMERLQMSIVSYRITHRRCSFGLEHAMIGMADHGTVYTITSTVSHLKPVTVSCFMFNWDETISFINKVLKLLSIVKTAR